MSFKWRFRDIIGILEKNSSVFDFILRQKIWHARTGRLHCRCVLVWAALNFEFDLYGSCGTILHSYVETRRNGDHVMSYTRTHPDVHKNTNIVIVTMDPQLWVHFSCSWPFLLLPVCVFFKCSNCSQSVVMTMGVNLFWLIFKAFFDGSHLTTATPAYEHWYVDVP